jgi:hypothetical protein
VREIRCESPSLALPFVWPPVSADLATPCVWSGQPSRPAAGQSTGPGQAVSDVGAGPVPLGPHETFARGRYALFRTTRGFADLVFMREGLRLALYLGTRTEAPCFFKIVRVSTHRIIHVAMLRGPADWRSVRPFLKEAYLFARQDESPHRKLRKAPGR